ncbi:hypothetical protein ACO2Q0_02695 [Phenylobacterium sp. VNQ135]|uniref:hypothetical protein n=1 Tax=Phenylobacterium sp. VNQ135 TaxID=3400922 RepID=UPI003C06086B
MTRSCETCEWARDEMGEPDRLACREGPDPTPVRPDHWCGRWRAAEKIINPQSRAKP